MLRVTSLLAFSALAAANSGDIPGPPPGLSLPSLPSLPNLNLLRGGNSRSAIKQPPSSDLINIIGELRGKRENLLKSIEADEKEKTKLIDAHRNMQERLQLINEGLERKKSSSRDYDRTITDAEREYLKILSNAERLLADSKRSADNIGKKRKKK